jgi:HlyD family secretion protein
MIAMREDVAEAFRSIHRYRMLGLAAVGLFVFGIGGWAATTDLSGAVVAQGQLVVDSSVKKVQHVSGGIVGDLRVREGDHVKASDILVRLDETQARAAAAIVSKNLDDLLARQARLEAEREGAAKIAFPSDLLDRASNAESDAAHAVATEEKLFELRRSAREGQKAQLKQRISQLNEEIQGYSGQIDAKGRELDLIGHELEGVRDLRLKNLVSLSRMTSLEREAARLEGERSQLIGNRAQAKGKITETELQILQIDQDMRSDVGKDLADARAKISELVERKIAAEDQLKRIDIRAPQDGIVHELSVHTVGGVITPGETVMLIVPDADALTVEAKVAPQEIDQLFIGQKAALRFSAFNQRSTPEIEGQVSLVSADLTQDQRTGVSYYTIRIALSPEQIARLGSVKLVPGMPVETFVHTGERTALSYLMKPLRDQAARAFKEK